MFYVLLTYGAKPSGSIRTHPAAKTQIRFYDEVISKNLIQKPRFVYDYARNAQSLNDLPNLKRWLEVCKKADNGRILIDDITRLTKIIGLEYRVSFLEELKDFGAFIHSIKHKKLLLEFSGTMLTHIVLHPELNKHPAQQIRHQDTRAARRSSEKTRSFKALRHALPLKALREEIISTRGRATLQEISDEANLRGLKSSRAKNWTPQNVARALKLLEESKNAAHE
ncbi:MAG: hypothetical protein LC676_19595 [Loktanella sp.]|nr:hypothetical protein [Loktanella sp.]